MTYLVGPTQIKGLVTWLPRHLLSCWEVAWHWQNGVQTTKLLVSCWPGNLLTRIWLWLWLRCLCLPCLHVSWWLLLFSSGDFEGKSGPIKNFHFDQVRATWSSHVFLVAELCETGLAVAFRDPLCALIKLPCGFGMNQLWSDMLEALCVKLGHSDSWPQESVQLGILCWEGKPSWPGYPRPTGWVLMSSGLWLHGQKFLCDKTLRSEVIENSE